MMLGKLPDEMNEEASTPAAGQLFETNGTGYTLLDKEQADMFHHNVAKLLFLYKRARPEIQTAVAFLCTRVKGPDTDDYKKLARIMKYLRSTIHSLCPSPLKQITCRLSNGGLMRRLLFILT